MLRVGLFLLLYIAGGLTKPAANSPGGRQHRCLFDPSGVEEVGCWLFAHMLQGPFSGVSKPMFAPKRIFSAKWRWQCLYFWGYRKRGVVHRSVIPHKLWKKSDAVFSAVVSLRFWRMSISRFGSRLVLIVLYPNLGSTDECMRLNNQGY